MKPVDYVSLEIAKMLKLCGYNERTSNKYVEKIPCSEREEWDDEDCCYKTITDVEIYPKPTLYEVLKWLLNNHSIYVSVYPQCDNSIDGRRLDEWGYCAYDLRTPITVEVWKRSDEEIKTYEAALSKGIKITLEMILEWEETK